MTEYKVYIISMNRTYMVNADGFEVLENGDYLFFRDIVDNESETKTVAIFPKKKCVITTVKVEIIDNIH